MSCWSLRIPRQTFSNVGSSLLLIFTHGPSNFSKTLLVLKWWSTSIVCARHSTSWISPCESFDAIVTRSVFEYHNKIAAVSLKIDDLPMITHRFHIQHCKFRVTFPAEPATSENLGNFNRPSFLNSLSTCKIWKSGVWWLTLWIIIGRCHREYFSYKHKQFLINYKILTKN